MMNKFTLPFITCLIGCFVFFPSISLGYSNPLDIPDSWVWEHGGFYGEGDPYILKHNGIYYLYVSTVDDKSGVKVWKSNNLIDWEYGGLVTEEASTKAAYAPEVTYWNGAFYMYTSPGGNGHYVYKSDSPLGPFKKQTENLGMGIDGHVFIDDDGKWYFYSTGSNQIIARPMSDPYTFGEPVDTGAAMNGWTEGATLLKRNGKYFMTYTGNHIWNKAYRINYSSSDVPTNGFGDDSYQNPIIIQTEGSHTGLGHNSIIKGPDLDTDYIVYHSHANPGRETNIDRIVWNGDKMLTLGPTTTAQPNPDMPEFSDPFKRDIIGDDWENVNGGDWKISNKKWLSQDKKGDENWYRLVTTEKTAENYTAEFNMKMKEQGTSDNPRFGAIFSYTDEENYGVALLSPKKNRLETFFKVDGIDQGWESTDLPSGYDYSNLHQIRVEKEDDTFKIYVDGMLKQTRKGLKLNGGKTGYTTQDLSAHFGYVAFSNKVNGSNAFDAYKPLPGSIEAVHYNTGGDGKGYHELTDKINLEYRKDTVDIERNSEGGYMVGSNQKGEWLKYNTNISASGKYDLSLRVASEEENTRVKLWLDEETDLTGIVAIPDTDGNWQNILVDGVALPEGKHTIKVEVLEGSFDFSQLKVNKHKKVTALYDDFNDGNDEGWTSYDGDFIVDTNLPSPFDAYKPVPGKIEAPYYNTGGEGVAYHDRTSDNIGGVLREDAVDIRNKPQGGMAVGWNQTGEWLKYNINVKESGEYHFSIDTATTFTNAKMRLWLDDEIDLTGVVDVPSTGDWNNWNPVTVEGIRLPEGEHTIKLEIVNGEFDFASLQFASYEIYKPLPGLLEAEDYNSGGQGVAYLDNTEGNSGGEYRDEDVDIRLLPHGGYAIESFEQGEWLKYNVDISEEGNYGLDLVVSSTDDNAQVKLKLDDEAISDTITIPNTGGNNNWETITFNDIPLPEGKHVITVEAVEGEFELSKMIVQTFDNHKELPGTIKAVDYITGGEGVGYHDLTAGNTGGGFREDDVDMRVHPDGSYNIGWNQKGEWYKYNVNVSEGDNYTLDMKVATTFKDSQVRLWLDDEIDLTGVIDIPSTDSWDDWSSVIKENISLPAGDHTITVEVVNGEFDFHSFRFYQGPKEEMEIEGEYTASLGTFAKSVIGEKDWKDYSVEADINLVDGNGEAGLIFRVNNPADGIEYNQNRSDFMQGYVAYLDEDGVHLGKLNYNWEYLDGVKISGIKDEWQHMKVEVLGSNIRVYVGDMETPKIDYEDHSVTAISHGKVGVKSLFSNTKIDNFLVKPIDINHLSIEEILKTNEKLGNLSTPLYRKLYNKLNQSQHHMDKGRIGQATKHLKDLLMNLERNKEKMAFRIYEQLKYDVNYLIEYLQNK